MSRRKKSRAKRKDAPMAQPVVMFNDMLHAHIFGGDSPRTPEPERVHTTIEGRGVVARLKERA